MGVDLASALAPRIWQCNRGKSWYKKRQLRRWYFLPDVYIITRRNAARVRSSYGENNAGCKNIIRYYQGDVIFPFNCAICPCCHRDVLIFSSGVSLLNILSLSLKCRFSGFLETNWFSDFSSSVKDILARRPRAISDPFKSSLSNRAGFGAYWGGGRDWGPSRMLSCEPYLTGGGPCSSISQAFG